MLVMAGQPAGWSRAWIEWMVKHRNTECRHLDFLKTERLLVAASPIWGGNDLIILSKA